MKIYILVESQSVVYGHGDNGGVLALKRGYPAFSTPEAAIEEYVQRKVAEKKAGGLKGIDSVEAVEAYYRRYPPQTLGLELKE